MINIHLWRWQTDAGDVMPKTGKSLRTTTYKVVAYYILQHIRGLNPDKLTKKKRKQLSELF